MLHLLPLLSTLLLLAAFPPYEASWCLYIALIPLFFYIDRSVNLRNMSFAVAAAGFLYGIGTLFPIASTNAWWWVEQSSAFFAHKELVLYGFFALLALVGNAIPFALFALGYKYVYSDRFSRPALRNWLLRALLVAALWAFLEYLRSYIPGGIAWQELGVSAAPQTYIRQLAHLLGVYGLSCFIVLVNALFYQWFRSWRAIRYPIALILLFVGAALYGQSRIDGISNGPTQSPYSMRTARVATIHSSLTTQEESVGLTGFRHYESAVGQALRLTPDIVVLPENAISFLVIDESTMRPFGYQLPGSTLRVVFDTIIGWSTANPDTAFLIGLHTKAGDKLFNSVVYIENGAIRGIYHKRHLLPLAEGGFAVDGPHEDGTAVDPIVFHTRVGVISPSICSEILYRDAASPVATVDMFSVSGNDAIFESPIVARRGRQVAIMRAVQSGKHIVVSTKGLESAMIDPAGEVRQSSGNKAYSVADIRF